VLCDLCFNLGIKGLTKFKKFLQAVDDSDYEEAALELKKSKYFTQVPNRAKRNIKLVLSVI
jgi:GH24 family phage-related lysozyme (muramidase)